MSADSWDKCPFCSEKIIEDLENKIAKLETRLDKAYETMTAKEYDEFSKSTKAKLSQLRSELEHPETVSIFGPGCGFDKDGNLSTEVRASCTKCGRTWYDTRSPIKPEMP